MLSTEILFIGIGQAGNKIVSEVMKKNKRIKGIFINSNEGDLKSISNANERNTVLVDGENGAGRDRNEAKIFAMDSRFEISDEINKYKSKKYVYFVFSMGGGTGSGMTPAILTFLYKQNPDIKYNVVAVLPKKTETRQTLKNTAACWDELMKLSKLNVNSIYLLDNSKRDTTSEINEEFASLFTKFLSLPDYDYNEDSVTMDKREIRNLGNAPGINAIYELNNDYTESDVTKYISKVMKKSIFSVGAKSCHYVGISTAADFNSEDVLDAFTILPNGDKYQCFSDEEDPMLVIGGATPQNQLILEMKKIVEEDLKNVAETTPDVDIEDLLVNLEDPRDKKLPKRNTKSKAVALDDIDESELWNDILNM